MRSEYHLMSLSMFDGYRRNISCIMVIHVNKVPQFTEIDKK